MATVALPPLNEALARELIGRTRVAKLLTGYRGHPAADLKALCAVLVHISQLLEELPEVAELDINPLLADETGVLALGLDAPGPARQAGHQPLRHPALSA